VICHAQLTDLYLALYCVVSEEEKIFHQSISAVWKDMSSAVWKSFSRVEKASEKSTCKTRGKEFVCNLINHLKIKHKELFGNRWIQIIFWLVK
jgi:hypothetical protein